MIDAVYTQFFGLRQLPFRVRPDAEFRFPSPRYLQSRASLISALHDRFRLVLLLGPPGVGKTLLLHDVLASLGAAFCVARINQPRLSAQEVLDTIGQQLGLSAPESALSGRPEREPLGVSSIASVQGLAPLIVVDDAHLMTAAASYTFCEILAQAPRAKLLLSGRPGQTFEAFAQRMLPEQSPRRLLLSPFEAEETGAYIDHRVARAAGASKELFTREAVGVIQQHTGGVARLINVLADNALHAACQRASGTVGATDVQIATQDPHWPEAVARDRASAESFRAADSGVAEPLSAISRVESPATESFGLARLIISHRNVPVTSLTLRPGKITIGRAADNELRLDDAWISRHHCSVTTEEDGVSTIEDLNSVNGISVNGRDIKRHVLKNSDQVRLGENTLTYVANKTPA